MGKNTKLLEDYRVKFKDDGMTFIINVENVTTSDDAKAEVISQLYKNDELSRDLIFGKTYQYYAKKGFIGRAKEYFRIKGLSVL